MSLSHTCPNCGADLPGDAAEELCPRCLMGAAAWSETAPLPPGAPRYPNPETGDLPQPGETFGGYHIVRVLGRGGMGAVYEAEERETGRRLALKILSHRLDSADARSRFLREGRLAASINHPNSVYVFGTEEIDGTPAISMELVPGGTLHDRVAASGPLPVAEAVDAILQIVAGLEAAQAIGILHRDVKPSNCFIDERGVAKIGDFGLSISTQGRQETHLTMRGTILGTPAFSSPEQLRGDELNARSDMYSVGATLFYLLTGQPPFDEPNTVRLLSRVLEEPVRSPRALRPAIPARLAQIVLRCLSKLPTDRFRTYGELASALAPFSSEAPGSATLALRVAAYAMDSILLILVGTLVQSLYWGSWSDGFDQGNSGTLVHFALAIGLTALTFLYFAVAEGRWGATVGKRMCHLGVVGPDGVAPGFRRALVRVLIFEGSVALPNLTLELISLDGDIDAASPLAALMVAAANCVLVAILFSTARRRNGFAAIHDLATRSRVVRRARREQRPPLAVADTPISSDAEPTPGQIGPYEVIETIGDTPDGQWLLGFDGKLLRRVWIRAVAVGTPPVPVRVRNVTRSGRLRWISGRRNPHENWDAYEFLDGQPLTFILAEPPQPWAATRYWLLDLAEELSASQADGSLPEILAIDRIWITREGRIKLLDLAVPRAPQEPAAEPVDALTPAELLGRVAALATRPDMARRHGAAAAAPPLPLHAQRVLGAIAEAVPPRELVDLLRSNLGELAVVTRRRRLAMAGAVALFPLVCLAAVAALTVVQQLAHQRYPDLVRANLLALTARDFSADDQRVNLRRYLAHEFRDSIQDGRRWDSWAAGFILSPGVPSYVAGCVDDHPALTPENIAAARATAKSVLAADSLHRSTPRALDWESPEAFVGTFLMIWILNAAIPSVLAALIVGGGFIMRLAGVAVVRDDGQPAHRLHIVARSLVAWSPFIVIAPLMLVLLMPLAGTVLTGSLAIIITFALFVYSASRPGRGLHDRIARTWLVPR